MPPPPVVVPSDLGAVAVGRGLSVGRSRCEGGKGEGEREGEDYVYAKVTQYTGRQNAAQTGRQGRGGRGRERGRYTLALSLTGARGERGECILPAFPFIGAKMNVSLITLIRTDEGTDPAATCK